MTQTAHPGYNFARLAVFAGFALAAGLVALAAQPPEVEDPKAKTPSKKVVVEDEDPKGAVKKKVVVDDPDPKPKPTPAGGAEPAGGNTPDARLDELARAADEATHPAAKAMLARFVVPFDRLVEVKGQARVKPIPLFRGDRFPRQFGVNEFDAANRPKELRNVTHAEVRQVDYFEEMVAAEVERWLKQKPFGTGPGPDDLTADDQLAAAEQLLAAAVRFHDYARTHPYPDGQIAIRSGKLWDDPRRPLVDRLKDVRLRQLQRAVAGADWQRARQLGTKLMVAYPKDTGVAKEVAVARVAEAELLMKAGSHADRVKARELLDEFESRFPGGGGDAARRLRKDLTLEAVRQYERAKLHKSAGNSVEARNDLDRAEALDPTIAGLRDLKRELGSGYPVLYVGVRTFPERMSPATARFDSERQAVELLFEGLLEEVPDGTGGARYRLGAALGFPTVVPGGRDVLIRQIPRQAGGIDGFDAHDVVETVKLLRTRPELEIAAGLSWLDDLPAPTGDGSLRVAFRQGHPDPRSLVSFKLLPGRWLAERGKKVDDTGFAERPFGTGPFRLHAVPVTGAANQRQLVFVDNPGYGRWRDRVGRPHLREIRFVEAAGLNDFLDDFRRGRLHILPDLTPSEMTRALSQGGAELGGKGIVVTAATNRRVHILALNHRRPAIQNGDLRRGIAAAIDREGILNEVFRTDRPEHRRFTAPMSGPFPPAAWATPRTPAGQQIPLLNRDEALVRLRRYLESPGATPELRLAYPAGDAQAAAACDRIKNHVESLFKDAADGRKITLILDPIEPRKLLLQTREEFRFDLAYMPYDYPDDWYPFGLASFLDPATAGRDGRNYTGFLSAGTNPDAEGRALGGELAGLVEHRDFAGQIAPRAGRIHKLFNEAVPFVPLWQLDRHMLVHTGLKVFVDDAVDPSPPQLLNPTVLFHNVARWRLE
ncbi:MAG: extracellular solute-binding protein [Gemmataceae bacterium]|nr:extracellular solute-binding protein [Gemmataceae bacterium]